MLGFYLHVPFCRRKCGYCDFDSAAGDAAAVARYVTAVALEVQGAADAVGRAVADTAFLGGGTPTALPPAALAGLLRTLREAFAVHPHAEVTCEANPESLTDDVLEVLMAAGVNRLSLGVQTFRDDFLLALGRAHDAAAAEDAWWRARRYGFENISLDLMYGLPGQTLAAWNADVEAALKLKPNHVSVYALTLAADVPLAKTPTTEFPDEETEREMYYAARRILTRAGYDHYEISNYCRHGRECRHNLKYWQDSEYVGFGPSAASHWAGGRYKNPVGLEPYVAAASTGRWPLLIAEPSDPYREMRTAMTLGLRLIEGIDANGFEHRFGVNPFVYYAEELDRLAGLGLLEVTKERIRLSVEGLWLSDEVFAALI